MESGQETRQGWQRTSGLGQAPVQPFQEATRCAGVSEMRVGQPPVPEHTAARIGVQQKLAEALSSQYGLNVFVAGLLLLLAWAVHASRVGKGDLLGFLTALMLLQLVWMLWYMGRSAAQRRLIRPKDTQAGARWLRGEWGAPRPCPQRAPSPLAPWLLVCPSLVLGSCLITCLSRSFL